MKGFNIAPPAASGSPLPPVSELMQTLSEQQGSQDYSTTLTNLFPGITPKKQLHGNQMHQFSQSQNSSSTFGETQQNQQQQHQQHHVITKLGKLAPKFNSKRSSLMHKRRWGTLIEAAKSGSARFMGRSRSEDSVCNTNRIESISQSNSPGSDDVTTDNQTDSNPSLDRPDDSRNNSRKDSKTHHHHLHGLRFYFCFLFT